MFTDREIEKQKIADDVIITSYWEKVEVILKGKTDENTAKKIVLALKNYFEEVFAGDLISWLANLYDYESGGFYYSNSARDNDGFLPDLESTEQAMGWLFGRAIKSECNDTYSTFYPKWMQAKVVKFVKERQDKNGYFYHPQWPRTLTDSKPHRRGRDLTWACNILKWFDEAPTYDTPNGVRGNGLLWDGTPAPDFSHREFETPNSNEELVAPNEELVAPHLKNKESFVAYLDTFDLKTTSYGTSNTMESQSAQLIARDKVLKAMGADYSLCDILVDWYEKNQDPKTGLFTFEEPNARGVNGLMKASSAVYKIQRPYPNALRGIESAIKVIEGDDFMASVCFVMNPLCAINTLLASNKKYGKDPDEGDKYRKYIFDRAIDMIEATKKRILAFKKPDGSFSYEPHNSSVTSQGHPVAVLNTDEGDMNATIIGSGAIITHLLNIFGLPCRPIFTGADVMRFMNIVESKKTEALSKV